MENTEKKNHTTLIFVLITIGCVLLLIGLIITMTFLVNQNKALTAEQEKIVEEYNQIAGTHENLVDPDYAEVYYNGKTGYIPSENIVIEYRP